MMSTADKIAVRQANAADSRQVSNILAAAFGNDPVINWLSGKAGYSGYFFDRALPLFAPHGHLYMADNRAGAIVCLPPGVAMAAPLSLAWGGVRQHGLGSAWRLLKLLNVMEQNHPKQEHYYIFAIGVCPQAQGSGVGSVLLEHTLRLCERDGMPVYLRNSNPRNLPWYGGRTVFKSCASLRWGKAGLVCGRCGGRLSRRAGGGFLWIVGNILGARA